MATFNGLYTITNVLSETRLDLANGKKADGSKVVAWAPHQPTAGEAYGNQVWEIKPSKNQHCYTIVNAKTGTYLEVIGGMSEITRLGVDGVLKFRSYIHLNIR
ncbi:carbohydrate-binding module family 13 protein [Favolaschia claudopus]|uniref:Carbohydrate-binding module family 13 protein n=1 Tax=Favolaschia claudopus TaxID=2862362 RepID=A0AAV9Z2G6_9AGAR